MTTKKAVQQAAKRLKKARKAYYSVAIDYLLLNGWSKFQDKHQPPMFRQWQWDGFFYGLEDALSIQFHKERMKDEQDASKG